MNRRLIFIAILLTICLDFFNLGLIYPIFSSLIFQENSLLIPAFASEFYKNTIFGILIAAFPFGQFFGAPVIGQLSDHHGRRKLLIISLIGTVATLLMCALGVFWSSLTLLLCGRFLGGLMAGNMTLAYASLADFSLPEEKVRNFALIPLVTGIGFAFGPYLAGILANPEINPWSGPEIPFIVATLFSMINLFMVVWKFPEIPSPQKPQLESTRFYSGIINLRKAFQSNATRPYLWIFFFMISSNFLFVQFVGPFAIERFHINVTEVGYLYANIGLSVAFGHMFLTRKLGSYVSSEVALGWSLISLAILLVLLTFSMNMLMLHALTSAVLLACAVGYTNSMALVSNNAGQDGQGTIMGVAVSVQNCAEFLPAAVVGLIAASSQNVSILTSAGLATASYLVLLPHIRKALIKSH